MLIRWFYGVLMQCLEKALLPFVALFHSKLKKGVQGRRQWRTRYASSFAPSGKILWMHVASLGEFEQGRPLLERWKAKHPEWKIVLTFFSPSGYEMRKDYAVADFTAYLPWDTPGNARDFVQWLQPSAVVFVKYEFWPNYLRALAARDIPVVLIAALFRPEQPFFKWYGGFWRQMLFAFAHVCSQTEASAQLLRQQGYHRVSVCGDTRVDRVLHIAGSAPENDLVARFAGAAPTLIIGSSWDKDERHLLPVLQQPAFQYLKIVCAPHNVAAANVNRLMLSLGNTAVRYSQAGSLSAAELAAYRWLVIDNIGLLNTLYRYGTLAYIGGGFGAGIHNTLEPAAWGLPVVFGPNYHKFEEAKQLLARGGGFCIHHAAEWEQSLRSLLTEKNRNEAVAAVRQYMNESRGATDRVVIALEQVAG